MKQIIQTYSNASPENKILGKKWYQEAHDYCKELSEQFNVSIEKVIGVISSLSPRREWSLNMRQTKQYLEGKRRLHTKVQMAKCNLIYQGKDPLIVLGGMKTTNFYQNILDPSDPEPCTIDVHMLKLYPQVTNLTPKRYNNIKSDFQQVAKRKGTLPNRVQSVCWLEIKQN